jgi:septum formation inhibitor-activating ATPase MinD
MRADSYIEDVSWIAIFPDPPAIIYGSSRGSPIIHDDQESNTAKNHLNIGG